MQPTTLPPSEGLEIIGFSLRTDHQNASQDLAKIWGQVMQNKHFTNAPTLWASYYAYDKDFNSYDVIVGIEPQHMPSSEDLSKYSVVQTGPLETTSLEHIQTEPTPLAVTKAWQELWQRCPQGKGRQAGFDLERWSTENGVPSQVDIWVGMKHS